MADITRRVLLQTSKFAYQLWRPLIFRQSASQAHESVLDLLARMDSSTAAVESLRTINKLTFPQNRAVTVGGVKLPHPLILAAGFVKGIGFTDEGAALRAVRNGENIIPGWRALPALVGPVEFGSYTYQPRVGNPGTTLWRHPTTHSTQNRVGLRNPGAVAAASFLSLRRDYLPHIYGINIAVSPGLNDLNKEAEEVREAISAFLARGVHPSWFTLNLSCPNTEDDPEGNQTEAKASQLCGAVVNLLKDRASEIGREIPLWVKIGPGLDDVQYAALLRSFQETEVSAIIATNTIARPTPDNSGQLAGVGGGDLYEKAIKAVEALHLAAADIPNKIPVIGCGGIQDPATYAAFQRAGASAMQYWSALVYRGPLAAALILDE